MEFNFFLFSLRISEALLIWPKRKSWEELNKCHGMNSVVLKHAPLSMEFSRQEYWSRLPFPSLGDLPDPGIEPTSPVSPVLQADSLPAEPLGKPISIENDQ